MPHFRIPNIQGLLHGLLKLDAGYFPSECYRFCQVVWQDEEHADHQEQNNL